MCAYLLQRDNWKKRIDSNVTLANLAVEKNVSSAPDIPPKICNGTSTAKNSSDCFNKQASLDENVDGKILQLLDDLLNLFDRSGKTSQGIKEQVNESFQNSHIRSESRLTG